MKKAIWLFICILLIFSGCDAVELKKLHDRPYTEAELSESLKRDIEAMIVPHDSDISVINDCLSLVATELSFAQKNDIPNHKANCVGYAKYAADVINYAFKVKHINDHAKPVVGHVISFGINLNKVLPWFVSKKHKSFVKDHDFIETNNYYIDPTIYDSTDGDFSWFINYLTIKP